MIKKVSLSVADRKIIYDIISSLKEVNAKNAILARSLLNDLELKTLYNEIDIQKPISWEEADSVIREFSIDEDTLMGLRELLSAVDIREVLTPEGATNKVRVPIIVVEIFGDLVFHIGV